jgi:hypothetical protein
LSPKQTTPISLNHDGRMTVSSSSTGNFQDVAEVRTRGQDAGQRSQDKQNKFKCLHCEDEITFSRKSDLYRHHQLKRSHGDHPRFVCNAQGCSRGQVPWSFARSDKLTSHIKTTHNLDTIFSCCPIKDCSFRPCTLEDLGVHIQRAHHGHEAGRAILNATSCKALRCPLWRCGKHVTSQKLLHHVTSHAKADIEAAKPSFERLGLLVQSRPGCDVTTQVVCPICHTVSADIEQFTKHISTVHLYTPQSGGLKHIEKWRAYLGQKRPGYSFRPIGEFMPWRSLGNVYVFYGFHAFACPSCPFSVAGFEGYGSYQRDKERAIREHHLSLLRPEAEVVKELYPYRMQILRLWPEFVTHPVFADFDQPRKQSESGPSQAQPSLPGHVHDAFEIPDWTAHDSVPQFAFANLDQPQGGPSEVQASFSVQFDENFWNPDWTTYDFNASM